MKVAGKPAGSPYTLDAAVESSDGRPITASFEVPATRSSPARVVDVVVTPRPELPTTSITAGPKGDEFTVYSHHLFGLTPVLSVAAVARDSNAEKGGILPGDVFARIGATEWPSQSAGMAVIRASKDADLHVVIYRKDASGTWATKDLHSIHTTGKGQLGFTPDESTYSTNVISAWPGLGSGPTPSGGALPGLKPGTRIIAANGQPAASLGELRNVLKGILIADARAPITLTVQLPSAVDGEKSQTTEQILWPLTPEDIATLTHLGWDNPLASHYFEPERFLWKADSIGGAITWACTKPGG